MRIRVVPLTVGAQVDAVRLERQRNIKRASSKVATEKAVFMYVGVCA